MLLYHKVNTLIPGIYLDMGHSISKNYLNLQKKLDGTAQGTPSSETLFKILKILFTETEADLVSILPLNFFTVKDAAKRWKIDYEKAAEILNGLADKGILLDMCNGKHQFYILAPTMAGFFEHALMRTDGKFDRKILSELFYQYINVEEDFIKRLSKSNPGIVRVLIQEKTISDEDKSVVLDYEKASKIIKTATCIAVGQCYCRHKRSHIGNACDNPQDTCLSFNKSAESLSKHGIAKKIDKVEAQKILDKCEDLGLVHIGDNAQNFMTFICNCCGCCCEALQAYKKFSYTDGITKSNFTSSPQNNNCTLCRTCIKKCPVDAISIIDNKIFIDENICIGCGICARFCPNKDIKMKRKNKLEFVPKDTYERIIMEAISSGTIQNYIFDNDKLLTHQILRKFLKVILSLPPAKQIIANRQLQSRFIDQLRKNDQYSAYDKLIKNGD